MLKFVWVYLLSGIKYVLLDRVGLGSNKFNRFIFFIRVDDVNWLWNNFKVLWWNGKFYFCKNLNVLVLCIKICFEKEGVDFLWM